MERELCEKLYETYYCTVYSYLVSLSKDTQLSQELTQETFLRAMVTPSCYRQNAKESTWLCAIAKNLYFDTCRKQSRLAEWTEMADEAVPVEQQVADEDLSLQIHKILHTLQEPYREVFELRVFGELSFAKIGTVFGKTESWGRVTFHRAKLMIQERMK